MHKIGIGTSGTCLFCGSCDETLAHLFIKCEKTKEFWKNIKTWLSRSVNFEIFLDPLAIMFGISSSRHSQQATNVIYITGKYFIFTCARKNESLNIFNYQTFLKTKYVEQSSVINNRMLEKKQTFAAFIDMNKAFDCINRDFLYYKLLHNNITGNIYYAIKAVYSNTLSAVLVNDVLTDWFRIRCQTRGQLISNLICSIR